MKDFPYLFFIQQLLIKFTDLIFPPSTEGKLLRKAKIETATKLYSPGNFGSIEYLYEYSEKIVRATITENKFHHHPLAGKILGRMIEEWTKNQTDTVMYIPIPLGKKRLRQRGHNQVETILYNNPIKLNINKNILKRAKETQPQSHLKKSERHKNMKDVFICSDSVKNIPPDTTLVLIDDVVTTGATLRSARKALISKLPKTVKVVCLAIAH